MEHKNKQTNEKYPPALGITALGLYGPKPGVDIVKSEGGIIIV